MPAMAGPATIVNQAGPAPSGNGASGASGISLAPNGQPDGPKGGKRPLPHIDDIISVKVDIDIHTPIEKVLQLAGTHLSHAETSRKFGRPDFALRDYIVTNIIVLDIIKKNKGWVALQDNKNQRERYQRLLRQVSTLHAEYEQIKVDIKADNTRTGVQSTTTRPASNASGSEASPRREGPARQPFGAWSPNGAAGPQGNGSPGSPTPPTHRAKPLVHPKPQALHGNAVQSATRKTADDLAQRFARLRTNTASAVQDPRIRTHPIIPPKVPGSNGPGGPVGHDLPVAPSTDALASMPRLPDAIYNPARGTVSNEAAELPSSAPRAMFTRTSSTAPTSNTGRAKNVSAEEYGSPSHTSGAVTAPPKRTKPAIPDGETISAQDLVQYMRAGGQGYLDPHHRHTEPRAV